jgi:hypothetical protein
MLTVDDVSKELSVSKVTIYAKLKKFNDKVIVKQGKKYITEDLFNLIKEDLKVKDILKDDLKVGNNDEAGNAEIAMDNDDLINLNKDLINTLIEQLKVKDLQLEEKDKQIQELINLNKNNQVLLKNEQDKKQLQLEEHFEELDEKLQNIKENMLKKKEQKKGFFDLFK